MSTESNLVSIQTPPITNPIVNDFSITVGTVNGSGSQTANQALLRTFFKMGIPVSGKNIFPSNIQGLPTWYTIRVSRDGYLARSETTEIVVAMNPASFEKDLNTLAPGGAFFYADDIEHTITRDDIVVYPMPVKQLIRDADIPGSLRGYIANMVYVGVLAQVLGIDKGKLRQALEHHFKGKQKPVEMNCKVIERAMAWAAENIEKRDPYRVEPMDATEGCIMTDGNTAGALGTIYGGLQFTAWYPITPATGLPEALTEYRPILQTDPETGKFNYVVVQAEDELAAIGMIIGAGWAGCRTATATSGPGLSLMSEYAGLAYFAEIPIVVWNVQRMGPSTGLPTRTSQGDINLTYYLGQGDTKHPIFFPGSMAECFEFGWKSLDLAAQIQAPVFVLIDLDMGMNQWMSLPFEYPDRPIEHGKILWEADLENLDWDWGRYIDKDGDGITYRTVPGNQHPKAAYFTRGTGHDDYGNYSEDPDVWANNLERLSRKFELTRNMLPKPEIYTRDGAKIGVIASGSTDAAVSEACDHLDAEGVPVDYLRLRALPINDEVMDFIRTHERVYIVEMNRDGQIHQIIALDMLDQATKLISLTYNTGLHLTAAWVKDAILDKELSSESIEITPADPQFWGSPLPQNWGSGGIP
ncbi:MAG: 2-oxoacid:acceptor oxidoreductase subunit alpha [Chloroflexi bacterium]|nr:2-oxoacid:acceptor oxidoreductase subunit alpha [Chloroflexota bacterium]